MAVNVAVNALGSVLENDMQPASFGEFRMRVLGHFYFVTGVNEGAVKLCNL
jgi:hypothetical protein